LISRPTTVVLFCFFLLYGDTASSDNTIKVIVFPLNGSSPSTKFAWIGEGIALSLIGQLAGKGVKVMQRDERIDLIEASDLPPGAPLSRGSMIRVAQLASADLVVMGTYSGTEQTLKVTVRIFNVKGLKFSGDISAGGSLSGLPQMENELAWRILANMSLDGASSKEKFQERMRKIPNEAYELFIRSLDLADKNDKLQLLRKATTAYGDFPQAHFELGRLYYHKADYAGAIPHLMVGSQEAGIAMEAEFLLGTCYLQGDKLQQAMQAYSQILEVSRPLEALNNMGVAALRKGDISPALNLLTEAKNLARTDSMASPIVSLNLGIALHLQGSDSEAVSVIEDAIKAHPKNGMLQFLLSNLLRMHGESDKAAAAAGKAGNLGINVDKLKSDDPKSWLRPLLAWTPIKDF
jgi:tetratricopeptide (TPR) repeat protein